MKQLNILLSFLLIGLSVSAQPLVNESDTLRGSLNENRDWFDIKRYVIDVTPNYESKSIVGVVSWKALAVKPSKQIQIDLQTPLVIDSILLWSNTKETLSPIRLEFTRSNNVALAQIEKQIPKGQAFGLTIYYHGVPKEAIRPPWDGGWIWKKDANGQPWMSVACQGKGASVWYPCKDHQSDEPDRGAKLNIVVPDSLSAVANGRLLSKTPIVPNKQKWSWSVSSPINNYNIVPYIGHYSHYSDTLMGEGNKQLDLDYWVLSEDLEKAKPQFDRDVKRMLRAFEYWFGPYPFYKDGFKLVQSPHLGMEHQSAIAYGNQFKNGYMGRDLSGSGWGLGWDYIIIHESGHEWFANNITTRDIADMWVHEGFTMYSEVLFTEYHYGKKAADAYLQGLRRSIRNDRPMIGHYDVNEEGSGDIYNKGANLIHTIRALMNNDSLFRQILRGMNRDFALTPTTSQDVEQYWIKQSGLELQPIFDQYLRTTQIPKLEFREANGKTECRWTNCLPTFYMAVIDPETKNRTTISTNWTVIDPQLKRGTINANLYIQ